MAEEANVLSVGPAVMVRQKTDVGRDAFEVVYLPLIWLAEHTPLKKPLDAYVELWTE